MFLLSVGRVPKPPEQGDGAGAQGDPDAIGEQIQAVAVTPAGRRLSQFDGRTIDASDGTFLKHHIVRRGLGCIRCDVCGVSSATTVTSVCGSGESVACSRVQGSRVTRERLLAMAQAARKLGRADACDRVADACLTLAGAR